MDEHQVFTGKTIPVIRKLIIKWGQENYQEFPWRTPELSWHGLIAEVMLQRTRARNVKNVYTAFLQKYPDIETLAAAPLSEITIAVYPLGLAEQRAKLLKELAVYLVENEKSIPESLPDLMKLPGVGHYIASAWLSFHGGHRAAIIDSNVVRWICRMTDQPMDGETRRKKWVHEIAEKMTPRREWKTYNYALLDFTMLICAKSPKCEVCPIGPRYCIYGQTKATH